MKKAILLISALLMLATSTFAQEMNFKIIGTSTDVVMSNGEWTNNDPKEVIGVLTTTKDSIKIQLNGSITEYRVNLYVSEISMGLLTRKGTGDNYEFAIMNIGKNAMLLVIVDDKIAYQYLFTSINNQRKRGRKI